MKAHKSPIRREVDDADLWFTVVAVYCGSGYRASIAASILKQHGFAEVYNVPGSMTAWKAAGYPVEQVRE